MCTSYTAPLSFSVGLWNYQSAINKQISFRPLLLSLLLVSWAWLRPGFVQKTQQPLMFSLTTSLSLFIAFMVNWVPFIEELDGQLSSFSGDGSPLVDFSTNHFFITFNLHITTCVPQIPLPVTFRQNLSSLSPFHLSFVVSSSLPSPTHFSSLDVNTATDTLWSTLTLNSCQDNICLDRPVHTN